MKTYPHLTQPLQIGSFTLKNRMGSAPMGISNLSPDSFFTQENINVFEERARGGAAIVNMGESRIDVKTGLSHKLILALDNPEVLPSLLAASDAIRRHGAIPAIELVHPGGRTNPEYYDGTIWAPSDAPGHLGKPYTALDEETIAYIVERFGDAAEMAMLGGVELVTVHAGHGWLLHEFLSPLNNRRTDRFGGSLENRARITLMVLDNIRKKCGNNILLEVRLSGTEFKEGGITLEEQCEFARLIDEKVDIINVSAGSFHFPETNQRMFPNMFLERGCNVYLAEAVKKCVHHAKIATVGGLNDPDMMEAILADGKADLVYMARALVADPALPNKVKDGRADDITPCQRCNACLSESFVPYVKYSSRIIRCTANPNYYRETMMNNIRPAAAKKRVLVVGGGPSGMEAAITLSDRGHEVILCEQKNHLGGNMDYAKHVSFKADMDKLMNVLIRRVLERPIRVLLGTRVTPEMAREFQAAAVFAAIGAEPIVPPIPGIDGPNTVLAVGIHDHMDRVGQNVVVLGGGLVGCEEAIDLAEKGRHVTVVEMKPELCRDAPYLHHEAVLLTMEKYGIQTHVNAECREIRPEGAVILQDGKEHLLTADTIVIAAGLRALAQEAEALRQTAHDFSRIGDCKRPRKIHEALREGFDAATFLC